MPLSNRQYDEIMRSYEQKANERRHLIESRKKQIGGLSPRFADIDREMASLSVSAAKARLARDEETSAALAAKRRELSAEREDIVRFLGFSEDYLDPPYQCPLCMDTGYIDGRKCRCLIQASSDLIYRQSNLSQSVKKRRFSDFSLEYYSGDIKDPSSGMSSYEAAEAALGRCRALVRDFDKKHENIFLFGDTGTGKTFLAGCTAGELLDAGYSVVYFSAQRLFELLARETFGRSGQDIGLSENILECDLLIIDDLGTEMPNSFTASRLFLCLNERISRDKSTFISSNLGLQGIAEIYSERIFSRISESFTILSLFGTDIRIQKKLRDQ